jgi:hypothetical protein
MKTNSMVTRPMILQKPAFIAFNTNKIHRQKPGVVKLLPSPPPPDEKTLIELNALAAKHPFCTLHKAKKHDPL